MCVRVWYCLLSGEREVVDVKQCRAPKRLGRDAFRLAKFFDRRFNLKIPNVKNCVITMDERTFITLHTKFIILWYIISLYYPNSDNLQFFRANFFLKDDSRYRTTCLALFQEGFDGTDGSVVSVKK